MTPPYLALGLSGPQLGALVGSPEVLGRWDALPLAFTILGIDRVDGSRPSRVTHDSSAVGALLASRTANGRFLIAGTPNRDHPYNLARRVASLGHLSRGRSGLVLGVRDPYAAPGPDGEAAWGGARLGKGAPLSSATAVDAARVVRALERSWPYDSIIGDRATGILVRSDRIQHVDQGGAFPVAGPLTVPEPPTGPSVLAWYPPAGSQSVAPGTSPFDLEIGEGGAVAVIAPGGPPARPDVDGVVLRPAAEDDLDEVLRTAERLLATDFRPVQPGAPLRAVLGLAAPPCPPGRSAFPVPRPLSPPSPVANLAAAARRSSGATGVTTSPESS